MEVGEENMTADFTDWEGEPEREEMGTWREELAEARRDDRSRGRSCLGDLLVRALGFGFRSLFSKSIAKQVKLGTLAALLTL